MAICEQTEQREGELFKREGVYDPQFVLCKTGGDWLCLQPANYLIAREETNSLVRDKRLGVRARV